jgi:signal transduction histidine kinase
MAANTTGSTLARKLSAAIVAISLCFAVVGALGAFVPFLGPPEGQKFRDFNFYLLAILAEAVLLHVVVHGMVVAPLARLARQSVGSGDAPPNLAPELPDLVGRNDEIGALARALTAERRLTRELSSSLEGRVRERTADLERANEAKSRFLANMSHELRTPLNGVIALSETLVHRQRDAESQEMASLIVSSGRLLEQVLTDILDFSKIDAGQLRLEHVDFDLETLAFRIAELHRASAEDKGLAFGWRVSPETLGRYTGDPVRITQILSNLLSNAVKFTETGRVKLDIEAGWNGGISFAVTDTGIGFDDEVRGRLFNRFEQADTSTTRRFGGSGLGLAICASLTRMMGGADRDRLRARPRLALSGRPAPGPLRDAGVRGAPRGRTRGWRPGPARSEGPAGRGPSHQSADRRTGAGPDRRGPDHRQ